MVVLQKTLGFFLKKISSVIFPPICLHCEKEMKDNHSLFCDSCLELLTLCDLPKNSHTTYLFEKIGPALTLYSCFANGSQVLFSKTIAAYMMVQISRMAWPDFHCILNPSKSFAMRDLARELSCFLHATVVRVPKKGAVHLLILPEINEEILRQKKEDSTSKIFGIGIFRNKNSG